MFLRIAGHYQHWKTSGLAATLATRTNANANVNSNASSAGDAPSNIDRLLQVNTTGGSKKHSAAPDTSDVNILRSLATWAPAEDELPELENVLWEARTQRLRVREPLI